MLTQETLTFILGILSVVGIAFGVFNFFRKPQEDLDKRQAVEQKEVDGKAALLSKEVEIKANETDRRFLEQGKRLDDAFLLAANHTNTVDIKVDKLIEVVGSMGKEIVKLQTIIEERLPKK